jgi:hypothetical protein
MKGNMFLRVDIIPKGEKYNELKQKSSPKPPSQFLPNLVQIILG